LLEGLLHFADADAAVALEAQVFLDHQASEEARLAAAFAPPMPPCIGQGATTA